MDLWAFFFLSLRTKSILDDNGTYKLIKFSKFTQLSGRAKIWKHVGWSQNPRYNC